MKKRPCRHRTWMSRTKGGDMKCKKCGNEQFFTRYVKGVAKNYVCSKCNDETPIKNKKEEKIKKEDSE